MAFAIVPDDESKPAVIGFPSYRSARDNIASAETEFRIVPQSELGARATITRSELLLGLEAAARITHQNPELSIRRRKKQLMRWFKETFGFYGFAQDIHCLARTKPGG